jgi:HK97 family phage prohead protease
VAQAPIEFSGGGFIDRPQSREQSRPLLHSKEAGNRNAVLQGDELRGVGCVYGVVHSGKGGRKEAFVPGCFARSLASNQAIRLLLEHDESKLLATRADSLKVMSDDQSLSISCQIPDTAAGRQLKEAVNDDGLVECSVGYLIEEKFDRTIAGETVTFITDARLLEISLVRKGAVPGTKASIRSSADDSLTKTLQQLSDVLDAKYRTMRQIADML